MSYRVWGYTDDRPEKLSVLAEYKNRESAIEYARIDTMADCVEDTETDEIVWEYQQLYDSRDNIA